MQSEKGYTYDGPRQLSSLVDFVQNSTVGLAGFPSNSMQEPPIHKMETSFSLLLVRLNTRRTYPIVEQAPRESAMISLHNNSS